MNKQQLIEKIATESKCSKTFAENIVNCAFENIKKAVKKGDDVKLIGFGTFTKTKRKARVGRNPQTGKEIKIPACWAPKFRPGAEFKTLLK
jgi:DNA-binding protein HU-beta